MYAKHLTPSIKFVRHNSTIPTIMSYIKDKGTAIPFASRVLNKEEFDKYELFRNIKLGNYKWLDDHLNKIPLKQEEKMTAISYINGLKEQPYSVPNCFIGYWCTKFGISVMLSSVSMVVPAVAGLGNKSDLIGESIVAGSTLGFVGMNIAGRRKVDIS